MSQSPRILLVEDEVIIAICLELELTQAGYTICQRVTTGEEAVACVAQETPDLIFMDIRLAGELDGVEAARQIMAMAEVPIIFMTGYPDQETEERVQQLNPLAYCLKPVLIYELKPLIEAAVRS
jgi:CheY-like chemotaxis protein